MALTPLERLRGEVCDRLACRRQATDARHAAARAADLAARRAAAARVWQQPGLLAAPVVWLQPHAARLAPVSEDERGGQLAHLQALLDAEAVDAEPVATEPPPIEADGSASALPGRVCAFCAGRCCRHGAFTHAFVDRTLLQRWVARHPGASLGDAAADYAAHLPREHVEGSCLHHTRNGCTLPREMRSDICNRHACDGLINAQQRVADGTPTGLVVAMPATDHVQRAAWLGEEASRTLPRRPRA